MTHPIERASVEQAREILATAVADVSAWTAAHIRRGENEWPVGTPEAIRAIQQARDAGFAEGQSAIVNAAKPFVEAIDRLEADYGFDRPAWQLQCLMIPLSACVKLQTAIRALSAEANEGRCDALPGL